ncbi:hypothetical protein [Amycolatopsis sp. Poz14]|uniref:hypothetical protein n=1 Tax=Amycolatopsis sp. Poz14 TaxID=1447705 RepID=UPI001EE984A3|nr:hypothetical protein [Amycolatopsis sp. Poz14]MCG3750349.1 hypothetical protein [Amycolatopsis sp. Poz14]
MTETHGYRPRWRWFALFALAALVHPWDSTALIGLPLGLVATLVLVFVPRWPRWSFPRRLAAPAVFGLAVVLAGLFAGALVMEPPDPDEVGSAVFVLVLAAAFVIGSLWWWRPWSRPARARPKGPMREVRATLDGDTTQWDYGQESPSLLRVVVHPRGYLTLLDCTPEQARELRRTGRLRLDEPDARGRVAVEIGGVATPGLFTTDPTGLPRRKPSLRRLRWQAAIAVPAAGSAVAVAAGGAVAAFWFIGGSGWPVLIPALVWCGVAVAWARQARETGQWMRGSLTPARAALPDRHVWPGTAVTGWLVLEPGWPARFGIERCPPELAAELIEHRRLWVFGTPEMGEVLLGLPGQGFYAKAWLSPAGRAPAYDAEDPGVKAAAE